MKKFLPDLTAVCLAAQITLASALGLWADAPPVYYVTAEGQSGPTPEALLATADTDSSEAVKGAIARSLFYMDVRYEGDRPNEQDLKLTETTGQIASSTNFMGRLQTLLAWHESHPVDEAERRRNDLIFQN